MRATTITNCSTDELVAATFSADYCQGFAAGVSASPLVPNRLVSLEAAGAAVGLSERFLEAYLSAWASQGAPEIIHLRMPNATRSAQKLVDHHELNEWLLALKRRGLSVDEKPSVEPVPKVPFDLLSPSEQRRISGSR
jgi:hypothetical protein